MKTLKVTTAQMVSSRIHVHSGINSGCVSDRAVPFLGEENTCEKEKCKARIEEMKRRVEKMCPNVTQNGSIQTSV